MKQKLSNAYQLYITIHQVLNDVSAKLIRIEVKIQWR